jgi:putative transcriptional regulator
LFFVGQGRIEDLAAGKLLVASRDLGDPNFARSVVILIQYDREGAMGLILNRRTQVNAAEAFPSLRGAGSYKEPVYFGGPVSVRTAFALLRSQTRVGDSKAALPGVYLLNDQQLLEDSLARKLDATSLRVYVGYSGWGPRQLDNEVKAGAWHIFRGSPAAIFDTDPASMWNRLIGSTETRIARTGVLSSPSYR